MEKVKIILAIAVLAIIGFFIWKWSVNTVTIGIIKPPTNQFTARIESEIDSLNKIPSNVFCQKLYKDIQYQITDNHKHGFLGKNENDNNQWKEILSKNLYSAYAPKFLEQAMNVFKNSVWKKDDINFIRIEIKTLQNSDYLEQGSPIANSFKDINAVLEKYNEISDFIFSCNNFSFSDSSIETPFPDVSDKIKKSHAYLNNDLDNSYVNNCSYLKDGLRDVPQKLLIKHTSYISSKITSNLVKYKIYSLQSDYSKNMYDPLKSQIDAMSNDVYGVSQNIFDYDYNSLIKQLGDLNMEATEYFLSH